jgi:hypothetical protein
MMRTLTIAMVALGLLVVPASAQMGGKGPHGNGDGKKEAPKGPVIDEKAYKAAMERIPEPKQKYDPWGVVHEPAKK